MDQPETTDAVKTFIGNAVPPYYPDIVRRLHRRVQRLEGPSQSQLELLRADAKRWSDVADYYRRLLNIEYEKQSTCALRYAWSVIANVVLGCLLLWSLFT